MSVFSVCAFSVLLAVIAVYFKQVRSDFAVTLIIVCCLVLMKNTISVLLVDLDFIKTLLNESNMSEFSEILLKTLGISLTVQTAADICRDAGESAIASKVELFGKAEILVISIPLVKRILQISQEILT